MRNPEKVYGLAGQIGTENLALRQALENGKAGEAVTAMVAELRSLAKLVTALSDDESTVAEQVQAALASFPQVAKPEKADAKGQVKTTPPKK
jgi:seryl-tRNA synthetase